MEALEPRFEDFGPLLVAGSCESYTDSTSGGIPAQWERFAPHLGRVPGQIGRVSYGVLIPRGGPWDYACAVEVSGFLDLPAELWRTELAKQRYAVFSHRGHISTIRETWNHIWKVWVPASKPRIAKAPQLERYGENFRPAAIGNLEILIPISA